MKKLKYLILLLILNFLSPNLSSSYINDIHLYKDRPKVKSQIRFREKNKAYLLWRRSLNPRRFDFYHPTLGRRLKAIANHECPPYISYLLWRRSLNPKRFDFYHPGLTLFLEDWKSWCKKEEPSPPNPPPGPPISEPSTAILLTIGLVLGILQRGIYAQSRSSQEKSSIRKLSIDSNI